MTATQKDIAKRTNRLHAYMYDSELRAISELARMGRYWSAYKIIRDVEKRCD